MWLLLKEAGGRPGSADATGGGLKSKLNMGAGIVGVASIVKSNAKASWKVVSVDGADVCAAYSRQRVFR